MRCVCGSFISGLGIITCILGVNSLSGFIVRLGGLMSSMAKGCLSCPIQASGQASDMEMMSLIFMLIYFDVLVLSVNTWMSVGLHEISFHAMLNYDANK